MGRKHKHEEHVNLERWLVSYADFITLLFALFVILYALSQLDLAKFKDMKKSLREAFNSPSLIKGGEGMMSQSNSMMDTSGFSDDTQLIPPILQQVAAKEEEKNFNAIQEALENGNIGEGNGIKTEVTERGLVIRMLGNIFFEPSTSNLKKESEEVVKKVGKLLKEKFPYNLIRVEGHTDSQPMNSTVFPSNWELSAFRAANVVRYFIDFIGIKEDRFVTVGYAHTRPIANNDTKEGRNANRRVEIVILRSKFVKSELQTYKFKKERKKRLENIEQMYRKKMQQENNMSEAAKKLMSKDKKNTDQLILYGDPDSEEKEKLLKQLKEYEKQTEDTKKKQAQFFKGIKHGIKGKK